MMLFTVLTMMSIIYKVYAATNNNPTGLTIGEINQISFTELSNDFGVPLTEADSDSMWDSATEFQWEIMNFFPTQLFPFLVCNNEPEMSGYRRIQEIRTKLEATSADLGHALHYFSPYDDDDVEKTNDETSSITTTTKSIEIHYSFNTEIMTCIITSAYAPAIQKIFSDDVDRTDATTEGRAIAFSSSQYLTFQPLTPSMKLTEGIFEQAKHIIDNDNNNAAKSVDMIMDLCPGYENDEDTSTVLKEKLYEYMVVDESSSLDATRSPVYQESFFANMQKDILEKEQGSGLLQTPPPLSDRMQFWLDSLLEGVENEDNNQCIDTINRVQIKRMYGSAFSVIINKEEGGFSSSYQDKACVWSVISAFAEMPSICLIQMEREVQTFTAVETESSVSAAKRTSSSRDSETNDAGEGLLSTSSNIPAITIVTIAFLLISNW